MRMLFSSKPTEHFDRSVAGVRVRDSCFHVHYYNSCKSWNDASKHCRRLGGRLASLTRYETWKHLWRVLKLYRSYMWFHVGLRTISRSFPSM